MHAVVRTDGRLTYQEVDDPVPGDAEVLVRVHAAALNNADLTAPDGVAGYEFAGVVEDVGPGVDERLRGTRVMGSAAASFADLVVARADHLLELPDDLPFTQAAPLPTALLTEYGAVRTAGLRRGDAVLVTAASSGIALVGVQVARELGAATIIGTTRREENRELLTDVGVDHVLVTGGEGLADRVRELTGGRGADVVLDHVGGPALAEAIGSARTGGSVVSVGRLAGPTAEIDLFALAASGVPLRSVSYGAPEVIAGLLAGVRTDLGEAIAQARVRAVVDSTVPLPEAETAVERLRAGRVRGKVVLEV